MDENNKYVLLPDKYVVNRKEDVVFNKPLIQALIKTPFTLESKYDMHVKLLSSLNIDQPNNLYIKKYIEMLNAFKNKNSVPNIILHGYNETTVVNVFLRDIYGNAIDDVECCTYDVLCYGNVEKKIDILQSPYHIVIEPTNSALDKSIIQTVVKEYATTQMRHLSHNGVPFKIVLIKNAHNLALYAQTSLRRTMEEYHSTCRFILCTDELNKIIQPLLSRCILIRLPKPTNIELVSYAYDICRKENINITLKHVTHIVNKSERDIKTCLWWLEYYRNKVYSYSFAWKENFTNINNTLVHVYKTKKILPVATLLGIRSIFNKLLVTNIPSTKIIIEWLNQIIKSQEFNQSIMSKIIEKFYIFEALMCNGTRYVIHLEALLMSLLKILYLEKVE